MKTYFLISNSDGDTTIREVSRDEIIRMVKDEGATFAEEIPEPDTNYWGDVKIVISGDIIVPYPVKTVVDWKLTDEA